MTNVDISQINNGNVAEQFVGQELAALPNTSKHSNLYYK